MAAGPRAGLFRGVAAHFSEAKRCVCRSGIRVEKTRAAAVWRAPVRGMSDGKGVIHRPVSERDSRGDVPRGNGAAEEVCLLPSPPVLYTDGV